MADFDKAEKNLIIFDEILVHFHPHFSKYSAKELEVIRLYPRMLNAEKLIEEACGHAADGLFEHSAVAHQDFTDPSEMKTATVFANPRKRQTVKYGTVEYIVYICEITSVKTKGKKPTFKNGALRLVVFEPFFTKKLRYYFIPQKDWRKLTITKMGSIPLTYSVAKDEILQIEQFRVKDFKTLSTTLEEQYV